MPTVTLVSGLLLALVASGWLEVYLDPEAGLGYWLGVVGALMMVLLLCYTARKRLRIFRWLPQLRHLFRFHMALGVLAPTAILLHCNFDLGSTNSIVALLCMLLVSASGFFGRFVYARVHRGLFGSRCYVAELRREAEQEGSAVHVAIHHVPELEAHLRQFEALALDPRPRLPDRAARFLSIGWRGGALRREARRELRARQTSGAETAYAGVAHYVRSLCRVARFLDYERLFSLWHAVHVPLCILLFAATAVHVLAVHMY